MIQFYTRRNNQPKFMECEVPAWDKSCDVLVAGAGSGGIYAAVAARQQNKAVLLLEKTTWCGGQHIQGLVNGYYYGVRGGLYEEIDNAARADEDVFYDATDAKRLAIAEWLQREGVDTENGAVVTGIYAEKQMIRGVEARIGHQMVHISCRVLIDATGDGHLLRLLPVSLQMGRPDDGEPQPFSSMRCVYLDNSEYDGGLSVTAGSVKGYGLFHEYRDNGYTYQYDDEALTQSILQAHASHLDTLGDNSRFLYVAPIIGLREGVLYEGEQTLYLKDILEGRVPTDNLLLTCFSDVDKHGSDTAFDADIYQDWFVNCNLSTCTVYIPVPIGAVVPKGWKGLLTAGRCIAADSYTNSATRMNTDCFRIGEAVGTLAALAVDCSQDAMAVPADTLRQKLVARGFFREEDSTPEELRGVPSFWSPARGKDRHYVCWIKDLSAVKAVLSTDCPGVALWSCRIAGKEKWGDAIWKMSQTENKMLHYNAGVALGVMGDKRALPILREIIRERKPFYFMDCRRSNQMRSVIAICLCGRMQDEEIIDELLEMIRPEEYERSMYHTLIKPDYTRSIVKEQNSVYFQHISHAVAALVKIAKGHPARRAEIAAALHAALDDGNYIRRMTDAPQGSAYFRAAENCRSYVVRQLG